MDLILAGCYTDILADAVVEVGRCGARAFRGALPGAALGPLAGALPSALAATWSTTSDTYRSAVSATSACSCPPRSTISEASGDAGSWTTASFSMARPTTLERSSEIAFLVTAGSHDV